MVSANTFARYKLETGERIAEADARALEAQAQLAKFKSPRNMTSVQQSRLVEKLTRFKGTRFDMAVVVGDPEAALFLGEISKTLQLASWEWVEFAHSGSQLTLTYTWRGLPNVGQMGAFGRVDILLILTTLPTFGLQPNYCLQPFWRMDFQLAAPGQPYRNRDFSTKMLYTL